METQSKTRVPSRAERAPPVPAALNALGMEALRAGEPARARELFARAAEADPGASSLWLNLAAAERRLGSAAGEEAALLRALAADQTEFVAHLRLASLSERLGRTGPASRSWQSALRFAPPAEQLTPEVRALLEHGRSYVAAGSARFEAAVEASLAAATADVDLPARRRFGAALDHLFGRRSIHLNQCAGLHFPFLPAEEFFARDLFPWLGELEAHTPAVAREAIELLSKHPELFAPYVQLPAGTPGNLWSDLDRSPAWGASYLWNFGVRNDQVCRRCPATAALIETLPLATIAGRAPTVFFSVLQPGTRIPPHTGVTNIRSTVHLPLVVPENCGFRVGGERRAWEVGSAFVFDDTIEHEAWNDSRQYRAVLIFDVWNPYLTQEEQALLRAFYRAADATGLNPEEPGIR